MQFSFLNGAALAVSFASMLGVATLAYADTPKLPPQQAAANSQQAMPAGHGVTMPQASATNAGPYDSPDFTIPDNDIYP